MPGWPLLSLSLLRHCLSISLSLSLSVRALARGDIFRSNRTSASVSGVRMLDAVLPNTLARALVLPAEPSCQVCRGMERSALLDSPGPGEALSAAPILSAQGRRRVGERLLTRRPGSVPVARIPPAASSSVPALLSSMKPDHIT